MPASTTFRAGRQYGAYNPAQASNPYPGGSEKSRAWARDRASYNKLLQAQAPVNAPADRRSDAPATQVNPYNPSPTDPTLANRVEAGPSGYTPGQVQVSNVYEGWEQIANAEGVYGYQVRDVGAEAAQRQEFGNRVEAEKNAWDTAEGANERNWQNHQAQLKLNWDERENAKAFDYEKQHGKDYAARNPYQRQIFAGQGYAAKAYQAPDAPVVAPVTKTFGGNDVARDENGIQKYWEQPGGKSRDFYYDQVRTRDNRSLYARTA